jgi:hypothetical protein
MFLELRDYGNNVSMTAMGLWLGYEVKIQNSVRRCKIYNKFLFIMFVHYARPSWGKFASVIYISKSRKL